MQIPRATSADKQNCSEQPGDNLGKRTPKWICVRAWGADYEHAFECWGNVLRLMMFAPVHAFEQDGVLWLYLVDKGHPSYGEGRA